MVSMSRTLHIRSILLAVVLVAGVPAPAAWCEPVTLTVSAAANLARVMPEIAKAFTKKTGIRVQFNFASTRKLATQIEQGAPVDLLAAADRESVDRLVKQGLVVPGTVKTYAYGRLVLCVPPDSKTPLKRVAQLGSPAVKQIAIANPEAAPYGRAAREAMQKAGIWNRVGAKIVPTDTVQHALQLVETGTVDAAFVARSLLDKSKVRWVLVPADQHQPIEQAMCVVKGTKREAAARKFAAFILGQEGRAILTRFNYEVPAAPKKR